MRTSSKSTTLFADVVWIIAAIGALAWGAIGIFNWNPVDAIFGGGAIEETSAASRVVYAIVGVCGLVGLVVLPLMRVGTPAPRATRTAGSTT